MVYQNDAGGGTDATGTITISGTPTTVGFLDVWIGRVRLEVSIDTADTPTTIAAAVDSAVNAKSDLPVTSGVAAGVVTLTTKNAGTLGNAIPVAHEIRDVAGITVVDVQLSGGATDPDVQDALDAIFPTFLRHVYCTYNDATALGLLKTHLQDSADPVEKKRRLGWTGFGFLSTSSVNSLANTLNYERIGFGSLEYSKVSVQGHSLDYEIGGAYLAEYANGENPALPRNALPLSNILTPSLDQQYSFNELSSLMNNGVGGLSVIPGEGVVITRTVSTRTSTGGIEDFTLLDIQTQDTLDNVANALEFMFRTRFARVGITDQLLRTIKSEILNILTILEGIKRLRNVDANKDRIIVTEEPTNRGQINVTVPADVIPGLHVIAEEITLIF
jgi:phage tail sheath gpL-like